MHLLNFRCLALGIARCLCLIIFCNAKVKAQPVANIRSLKFINEYDIPFGMRFQNTTVGGLSGIDYDATRKVYYLISDDKASLGPCRFYTAEIYVSKKIDSVRITGVKSMLQPNGKPYPGSKETLRYTPDPEAMRYDAKHRQLTWSSEGERVVGAKDTILQNPAINNVSLTGAYLNNYQLPQNMQVQAIEKGTRSNGSLEGLAFANNYTTLFANSEEPLYEDGPRADTSDNNPWIRIVQFDAGTRQQTKQFAYHLERVAHPPFPAGGFQINGVSDILWLGKNKLLAIERSFSFGRLDCTIKLFIADLSNATDIKSVSSLKNNTAFVPATKKLLLNMDLLGIFIDNIEGVTFGPLLPNGHKTLVFIADNNFSPLAKSQVLLFEVIE